MKDKVQAYRLLAKLKEHWLNNPELCLSQLLTQLAENEFEVLTDTELEGLLDEHLELDSKRNPRSGIADWVRDSTGKRQWLNYASTDEIFDAQAFEKQMKDALREGAELMAKRHKGGYIPK